MTLEQIRIILVEPAGPLNVGAVARVMKNMGLSQLVLVNPQCDPWGEEARRMAVHGDDVLAQARQVESLPEALQGCYHAVATTGREGTVPLPLETPRVVFPWLRAQNAPSAVIFGREDSGLTNQELHYAQRCVSIPANPVYPSLNLAQAVAVCAYELYQTTPEDLPPALRPTTAPLETLEGYYQHLEQVLLQIGYLYPHTAGAKMEKFRRLYGRADLTPQEVALLRGILRQMTWFVQQAKKEV
ncbi:RNA methyltransferase [Spirulina subsalsa FACHB-351]|uniref:tRNA (cytidine/uridine-2'-O-)-methyltransferase TrmJ n=1 Tax=Spirulina subsalsa FACHB-351 TaxID=234711 RepID=A0ABT3L9D5_9CYAN|nr:RNA methyltransferase [Spirulina subsalsa FACHB-351]